MSAGGAKNQYLATLVVNMYMLATGIFFHWSEATSSLYWEMYQYHLSTYIPTETLLSIGGIIGSTTAGFVTMKFGRRTPLLYLSIPLIISCLLNLFVYDYFIFKASMVLAGIHFGGVYVIAPLYLIEIANNDRFRGVMLTSLMFFSFAGELIYSVFSPFSPVIGFFIILLTVVTSILFYRYFPDTPSSLYKRKQIPLAEESIRFYQNIRETDEHQLETLKREFDRVKCTAADGDLEANHLNPFRWADLKTKHVRHALAFGLFYAVLNACCGAYFITSRSMHVMHELRMNVSMPASQLIVQIVAVSGSCAAVLLVDRIGRKVLSMVSTVALIFGLTIYGIYEMFYYYGSHSYLDLIPTISSLSTVFFGFLGVQSLKFAVFTELMPDRIKDVGLTLCVTCGWIITPFYSTLLYALDKYAAAFISAAVCLVGAVIIHLKMPETKGKSHQEIMNSL